MLTTITPQGKGEFEMNANEMLEYLGSGTDEVLVFKEFGGLTPNQVLEKLNTIFEHDDNHELADAIVTHCRKAKEN